MNDDEIKAMHDEMINELEGPITVAGMEFEASRILEELDPIAYRISLAEYEASLDDEDE